MSKIAIIGAGLSGLTAAIYLKEQGHDVCIYEKNDFVGGRLISKEGNDAYFENYIRGLAGSSKNDKMYEVWEHIGAIKDTKFIRLKRFHSVKSGNEELVFWRDTQRSKKEMIARSPEDEEQITNLLDAVASFGIERINVKKPIDMTNQFELMAGGVVSGNANKKLDSYENMNIGELAAKFNDPLIRLAIISLMGTDAKAYEFIAAYGNFVAANAEIPIGGFLTIAKNIENKFKAMGGKIFLNCEIVKAEIKNKRVISLESADEKTVTADAYIFAADANYVFMNLLGEKHMQRDMKKAFSGTKDFKVETVFGLSFLFEGKTESMYSNGALETDAFMLGNDMRSIINYRLYDYDETMENESATRLFCFVRQDEEDYLYWKSISIDKESLEAAAMQAAENIKFRIEEAFPDTKNKLKILKCYTPIYFEENYNSYLGAVRGFCPGKKTGNYNVSGNIKGIKNAFLAGSFLGGVTGIRGAVISGKFAALRMLKVLK